MSAGTSRRSYSPAILASAFASTISIRSIVDRQVTLMDGRIVADEAERAKVMA